MESVSLALAVCLALAIITKQRGLPSIPFYIIAGLLIGESGLRIVAPDEISKFLTDLGLLFLLFFMGLEIRPSRILANRSAILKSGLIDLQVNMVIGFLAAWFLGFSLFDSLVVAAAFFISSTAMAVTSLVENHKLLMREAETVVWLMIFEDIALVVILALMGSSGSSPATLVVTVVTALAVLVIACHLLRTRIARLMKRDDDLPVLFTFTAVLGIAAVSSALAVPQSLMVIAFGTLLGSVNTAAFEERAKPFRDVFLVVFFVFFGIGVNLAAAEISLLPILVISALAVGSKFVSGLLIGRAVHGNYISGIEIWSNTTSRGEFSIAIAALYGSAVISGTIAAMVIITSLVGSFLAVGSSGIADWIDTKRGREPPPGIPEWPGEVTPGQKGG